MVSSTVIIGKLLCDSSGCILMGICLTANGLMSVFKPFTRKCASGEIKHMPFSRVLNVYIIVLCLCILCQELILALGTIFRNSSLGNFPGIW